MHDSAKTSSVIRGTGAPQRISYRLRDAAQQIGISYSQLRKLIAAGKVKSFKTGPTKSHAILVRHEDLVEYVQGLWSTSTAEGWSPDARRAGLVGSQQRRPSDSAGSERSRAD